MFTDYPTRAGGQRIGQLASGVNHADHLLRLYADVDGIDGLAWAIPLGSSVSVGISMPHGQEAPDADDVLSHVVEAAYRRRGLDLRAVVDNRSTTQGRRSTSRISSTSFTSGRTAGTGC